MRAISRLRFLQLLTAVPAVVGCYTANPVVGCISNEDCGAGGAEVISHQAKVSA